MSEKIFPPPPANQQNQADNREQSPKQIEPGELHLSFPCISSVRRAAKRAGFKPASTKPNSFLRSLRSLQPNDPRLPSEGAMNRAPTLRPLRSLRLNLSTLPR
jgi:hypothetical protein